MVQWDTTKAGGRRCGMSSHLRKENQMLKNQMLNRIFSEYKNNTWVYLAMSVAIAVLIVAWWVVSDSHPENDTHRVEENNAGRAVYPDMVPTDQG
jgi:hypothetical protein